MDFLAIEMLDMQTFTNAVYKRFTDDESFLSLFKVPTNNVAKKEIMMIPVIGWVMSVIGHIPFDRKTGGKKLLEDCGYMLENLKEDNSDVPYWFARN